MLLVQERRLLQRVFARALLNNVRLLWIADRVASGSRRRIWPNSRQI